MGWKSESKKKNIIIGVLAVSLVAVSLGLGLGLGLNRGAVRQSCRNRCYEPYDRDTADCSCDDNCNATNSCCFDYFDICSLPAQQWECTRLRCGEKRIEKSNCQCSDDCLSTGDCCANYKHVCKVGETAWVEDVCEDLPTDSCPTRFKGRQPVLLVSLDGLRAEYLQTWGSVAPVLSKLKTCGTSAPYMQAAFPTKTFPNHYTIVTGLYPESNGLIDNSMYDPVFDASFSLSSAEKDNPRWYLGEPIWNTVQYQGLKAGTFFWPGSDVKISGSSPSHFRPYDGKVPFEERVFTVLKWLQEPDDERPDFYTLYLEEPDKSGHKHGPVSGGVIEALQRVDKIIGQLMNGLKQLNLHRCVNIIILADHGMQETSCDRKVVLQDLVGDVSDYWVSEGPFGRIRAINSTTVFDPAGLVANMTCKMPNQKVKPYLKTNLPKRFHYANSRRIEDVNVLVDTEWLFERKPGSLTFCSGGNHGYDNDADSMHAMFLSYGPKFHHKTEIEPFASIELYNVMCDLLEIAPTDNNGTHGSMNHMLRKPFYEPTAPTEQSPPRQCPVISLEPADNLGCSCSALTGNEINSRLNISIPEMALIEKKHCVFGRPRLLQPGHSSCLLPQEAFMTTYSHNILMPLWAIFTINKPTNLDPLQPVTPDCVRADVRLQANQTATCFQYDAAKNLTKGFLYPPNLNAGTEAEFDALVMSNVVPMYPAFTKIWNYFQSTLLKKYADIYNGINVVTGPVFDYNYDGRYDTEDQIQQFVSNTKIPIPTHYFVLLTTCKNSTQPVANCEGELQSVSFLLPHRPDNSESCNSALAESQWVEDHMWFHKSRVRDVEWITGLDFYQIKEREITELLKLKTRPTSAIERKQ